MLKLWNTATRSLEEVRPIHPGTIGMYACGPTVYQRAHIGNLRAYLFEDVLHRTLLADGLKVRHVVNITDVGHLTDDADAGQDKLEKASATTGTSAWEIARTYTDQFVQDLVELHILKPDAMPKATDHIAEQIALIQQLEQKGFTYSTTDGVYFDTSRFSSYGAFSGQLLEEKEEGARVASNPEKRHPTDFALWKFSPTGEKRQMEWESPWGVGFPGWHIECSAMARKELGQPFDIHAGGVDHIPVHHENEIAQSVAAFDAPLANLWFHVEFLLVDGQKMSKSLGNTYTLKDLEERGFSPLDLRYFFLGAQYRQKQNFTWEALQAARNARLKLEYAVREWKKPLIGCADLEAEFFAAIHDDLNTPRALSIVWKTVDSEYSTDAKAETMLKMDAVLGLGLTEAIGVPFVIPADVEVLMKEREEARTAKNWSESDRLRDEILSRGWSVEDTKDGQKAYPATATFSS
jgi:cysteinyl-tRNA synthetase